tara:strand:+ start:170 stop:445 length:276 start_codon:yes stop_codon:yes gene_type:complete
MTERITKHYETKEIIRIQRWDENHRVIWDENPTTKTWWKNEYEEKGNIIIIRGTSSSGYTIKEVRNLKDEILYAVDINGKIEKGNTEITTN